MDRKSLRGSLLLLLGSVIWGAAFVAQRVGMDHMGPYTFNGIRMLLAWIVMIPVTLIFEHKAKKNPASGRIRRISGRRACCAACCCSSRPPCSRWAW